jgi:hypothetical protein
MLSRMKHGKRGRPPEDYITTWGEVVPGLYRKPDGRYRCRRTGREIRRRDKSERQIVAEFLGRPIDLPPAPEMEVWKWLQSQITEQVQRPYGLGSVTIGDKLELWKWLRHVADCCPRRVAEELGVSDVNAFEQLLRSRKAPLPTSRKSK